MFIVEISMKLRELLKFLKTLYKIVKKKDNCCENYILIYIKS